MFQKGSMLQEIRVGMKVRGTGRGKPEFEGEVTEICRPPTSSAQYRITKDDGTFQFRLDSEIIISKEDR
jgi:hypothetical protein